MNSIVSFDKDALSVRIQPGVTQKDLENFFIQNDISAMVPNTGIGGRGSIIGNLLERGFGVAPLQDHASSLLSLSCVLGNGSTYSSFFSQLPGEIDTAYKWGLGPYVDGLFCQSNFGIITEANIKLIQKYEVAEILLIRLKDDNEYLRGLALGQSLQRKLRGQFESFKLFDTPQIIKSAGTKTRGIGIKKNDRAFFAVLYSNKTQISSLRKVVRAEAKKAGLSRPTFISEMKMKVMKKVKTVLNLEALFQSITGLLSLAKGQPSAIGLNLLYPVAPLHELETTIPGIGSKNIIWYVPVMKLDPPKVVSFLSEIRNELGKWALDKTSLTVTSVNDSAVTLTAPILFDEAEREDSYKLYRSLLALGAEKGFFPYRIPIEFMSDVTQNHSKEYWQQIKKIKDALDPNNVIAPARYSLE